MKTAIKYLLLVVLLSLPSVINAYCQSQAPLQTEAVNPVGHAQKSEELVKSTNEVIIGKLISIGYPSGDSSDEDFYDQAEVEVISVLKGDMSGTVKVSYSVRLGKNKEMVPVIGTQYIMFIHMLPPNEFRIKKLLPATDDNISKVKQLISQATK